MRLDQNENSANKKVEGSLGGTGSWTTVDACWILGDFEDVNGNSYADCSYDDIFDLYVNNCNDYCVQGIEYEVLK